MKKRVGYIRNRYPEIRCIIDRGGSEWEYRHIGRLRNLCLLGWRACEILGGRLLRRNIPMNNNVHAIYRPIFKKRVDVIHTFNTVCDTSTPWVSTFETTVPRTNQVSCRDWEYGHMEPDRCTSRGYELLLKDSCLALIALSEANKKIQIGMMESLSIPGRDRIAEKILVCPPPQPVLITPEELAHKFDTVNDRVEFIYVGGLFFCKGGAQVVDAFSDLVKKYPNIHLTVISSLRYGDAVSRTTVKDQEKYHQILTTSSWITYYEKLPNAEVLELCKKAHVGLLPTLADTYGYSVLEMQACGCPVISTDIRALPEMNNDQCGCVIHVPKHPSTEAKYDTPEELETLKRTIYDGIYGAVSEIMSNPESLKVKGETAVSKIEREHSPEKYAQFLSDIFNGKHRA